MADPTRHPAFTGQRPPFTEGNEAAMRHGAWSERRLAPLADEILAALLAEEATPDYLRTDASFRPALTAWSRSEAAAKLVSDYLSDLDVEQLVGKAAPTLELLRKLEAAAATHRRALGLDPTSRARLVRDLSATKYMSGLTGTPLAAALERIDTERAALEGRADDAR